MTDRQPGIVSAWRCVFPLSGVRTSGARLVQRGVAGMPQFLPGCSRLDQGRLNIIGGPGQSNALRALLASGYTNFNGKLNQTCRCICIVTTSVGSRNSVREGPGMEVGI